MTPDSTQYFQFNSLVSMYVFTPSAGCMGEVKLIRPGNELIFSSAYQWDQRHEPLITVPVEHESESSLISKCPATVAYHSSWQFKGPLSVDTLVKLSQKNLSPETLKKV